MKERERENQVAVKKIRKMNLWVKSQKQENPILPEAEKMNFPQDGCRIELGTRRKARRGE